MLRMCSFRRAQYLNELQCTAPLCTSRFRLSRTTLLFFKEPSKLVYFPTCYCYLMTELMCVFVWRVFRLYLYTKGNADFFQFSHDRHNLHTQPRNTCDRQLFIWPELARKKVLSYSFVQSFCGRFCQIVADRRSVLSDLARHVNSPEMTLLQTFELSSKPNYFSRPARCGGTRGLKSMHRTIPRYCISSGVCIVLNLATNTPAIIPLVC